MTKPKQKIKSTTIRLRPELHRRMKMHCADREITHQTFITQLLEKTLPEYLDANSLGDDGVRTLNPTN